MSTTGNGLMSMMSEAASHCSTSKVLFINTALPWSVLLLSASLLAQRGEEIQGVVPESSLRRGLASRRNTGRCARIPLPVCLRRGLNYRVS